MAHEEGHEEELLTPTIGQGTHKPGPPSTFEEQLEGYDALLKIRGADTLANKTTAAKQIWSLVPETGQEAIKDTLKFTGNVIGGTYQDARTIEGAEWLSPHQIGTAAVIRAGEWALPPVSAVLDIPFQALKTGYEKVLPEKYEPLASGLAAATEVVIPYGLIGRKAKMLNRVFDVRVANPLQLPGLYGGVGQGFEVSRNIFKKDKYLGPHQFNWENFGYKYKQLPTVVGRAANMEEFDTVSSSLYSFYNKINNYAISRIGLSNVQSGKRIKSGVNKLLKEFDAYWENPLDGTPYRVSVKDGRYTLISARSDLERALQANKYSSLTQANAQKAAVEKIAEGNKVLKEEFLARKSELIQEQQKLIEDTRARIGPFLPGKTGSTKGAISASMQASNYPRIKELGKKISNLLQGAFYGEHGYNVKNKKMQDLISTMGWEKDFQLGNATNFHIVQEVLNPVDNSKSFQKVKNALEEIINSTDKWGRDRYPTIVVNYNPKLDGRDYSIRFEYLKTIKKGDNNIVSGNAFKRFEYGSDLLKVTDKISLRDAARFWIRTHVAKPTLYDPLPPLKKTPFLGKLRLNTRAVVKESAKELNERIKRLYDLTDDIFDKR